MKKINLLFLFLALTIIAEAQYTYITDRRFFVPTDLIGYDFRPDRMEVPNEIEEEVSAGDYSFGISTSNLYVAGDGIKGVYNINNFSSEDYGYKLTLMGVRDARLQGHLKVILNKYAMAELLIFKRSNDEKEIIFYLPAIPKTLQAQEREYFTDRGELVIEEPDSLWGKSIRPFLRIYQSKKIQRPLNMADSTLISFVEEVTIEEKIKKTKDDKKKKKETGEPGENVVTEEETEEIAEPTTENTSTEESDESEDPDKKVKITKKYYVVVRSILEYEDATIEDKTWRYEIKKVNSKMDDGAKLDEEKYKWEFVTVKGEPIYLFLNGDNTVSTMQIEDEMYLMRGF